MLKKAVRRVLPHPVYRAYRRRRVAFEIARYTPKRHTGIYGGHELELSIEDPLAEGWYGHDWPVMAEVTLLRELGVLRPGARVFDLGAHQAVVALMLSREVGADGHVVAVEAEPHNARVGQTNIALNAAANVEMVHAAVSAHDGSARFAESLNGHIDDSTSVGNVTVPAVTIDSLTERYGRPDLVYLDIEGYEAAALRAADRTLSTTAAVFVEVHVDLLVDGVTAGDLVARFDGWKRWINTGDAFGPFDGELPTERFFLVAVRTD